MPRKSPSKARQELVKSPFPNPSKSPLSPSSDKALENGLGVSSIEDKDRELAALLAEAEGTGTAGNGAEQVKVDPQPEDLTLYKRLVKPSALLLSLCLDKINRRFLKSEFVPMNDGQIALIEEDAAFLLKDALDKIMPEIAKRNPRAVSLCLTLGTIYAANTRRLPVEKEPAGSTDAKPSAPVAGSPSSPVQDAVIVPQPIEAVQ